MNVTFEGTWFHVVLVNIRSAQQECGKLRSKLAYNNDIIIATVLIPKNVESL
jgi:hypothetical protein